MVLTANSDVYGAVHEDAFNLLIHHIMRQRPSWFNYGSAAVAGNPKLWCLPIKPSRDVVTRMNPLMTVQDPLQLPLLGTPFSVALDFCVQIAKLAIDFHPGGTIALPPQLAPPLATQHFAIVGKACASIGCPSDKLLDRVADYLGDTALLQLSRGGVPTGDQMMMAVDVKSDQPPPPIRLPGEDFECFCLELFIVGHFETVGTPGHESVQGFVDGLEIVDITPDGLENALECYLRILCRLVLMPRLRVPLEKFVLDLFQLPNAGANVHLVPTPITPAVPHNPAIEDDQVKVFMDLVVGP